MARIVFPLLFALVPILLAGQEVPRSTDLTDQNTQDWQSSHMGPPYSKARKSEPLYKMGDNSVQGVGSPVSAIKPEPWPLEAPKDPSAKEVAPVEASFVEAKSLPLDLGVPPYDYDDPRQSNGRRVFGLMLQPGEKVAFNLKSEDDQVAMRAFVPTAAPPMKWKLELKNANFPPRSRRAKHLELKNPLAEPQMLYLILYGMNGHAYRVDLTRTPVKKG